MNAGNMPPQGGGGGKSMKTADPDAYGIVYGKKGSAAIDYDGDGKADNRGSGEAPLWLVDAKHWWSIVVAFRALLSAAWHNKFHAVMLFFALLGIIPAAWMGGLALFASNARQLTNKGAVSAPASAIYDKSVADNLKASNDIALSPREERANRR